jgi:hypothetical protein
MYEVVFSASAAKEFEKLPVKVGERLVIRSWLLILCVSEDATKLMSRSSPSEGLLGGRMYKLPCQGQFLEGSSHK